MKVFHQFEKYQGSQHPIILTIGNFDGVHLGHQKVLQHVREEAKQRNRKSAAITFSNHPSTILKPDSFLPLLCTLSHKIKLIQKEQIDFLFLLNFTKELSEQSPETFIQTVLKNVKFEKLILGPDATIGKNRQGDRERVTALAQALQFDVEYLPEYSSAGIRISSSKIREFIQQGKLLEVEQLLGRKYSIVSKVISGIGKGHSIGFPTANIDVQGLCLPPLGVYAVKVKYNNNLFEGVANLGIAPTVRNDNIPVLEVHLFDQTIHLYDQEIEVIFHQYIRPEKRFSSIEELKQQIENDIQAAKTQLFL